MKTLIVTILLVIIFSSGQMSYAKTINSGPLLLFSSVVHCPVIINHPYNYSSKHRIGEKELILRVAFRNAIKLMSGGVNDIC